MKSAEPSTARSQGLHHSVKNLLQSVITAVSGCFGRRKRESEKAPAPISTGSGSSTESESFTDLSRANANEDDIESFTSPQPRITDTRIAAPTVVPAAQPQDVVRMQQFSLHGMAGPLSRGVCQAATTEWFRRIDAGLPTWTHVKPNDPSSMVDKVDWQGMRPRLQHIQDAGQRGDPAFAGYHYNRTDPILMAAVGPGSESRSTLAKDAAKAIIDRARMQFNEQPPPENAFFQLDMGVKGRLWGRVQHTIGVHIQRPTTPGAGLTVHFFDANSRESKIPEAQFGQWLADHLESRYGSRLTYAMMASPVKRELQDDAPPAPGS